MDKWRQLKRSLPGAFAWPLDLYGGGFFTVVDLYLSARSGRPVGWNYQSLIQTAHRCMDIRPDFLSLLEACFSAFGRSSIFTDERYASKWRAKRVKAVVDAAARSDTRTNLLRLLQYRPAMEWLMPEVKHGIAATLAQLGPPGD